VATVFPLAADSERAARVLEAAIAALVNGEVFHVESVDALGAPLRPALDWETLRLSVRALVGEVGVEEAARRYGCAPESLTDVMYRTRPPGAGRQARLLRLVASR
jgi:hypothetical protein